MIRAVLLVLLLPGAAAADAARILSGEHGTFTRLVIELPAARAWTVGRTARGYAFAVEGASQPDYDLSTVWQRISDTRLRSLTVDPDTGALDLALGCDCHVFPFEYRPGAVVLDIKPGTAPEASAFEADFAPAARNATTPGAGKHPRDYDWLSDIPEADPGMPVAGLPILLGADAVSLDPLRGELLKGLSRGAAHGIVEFEMAAEPGELATAGQVDLPWASIRIGEVPGVAVADPGSSGPEELPMSECADDELVDLAGWGGGSSALDLLAQARTGLFGEFDAPDTNAVLQSVRLHLFLGFGAEARQQADLVDDPSLSDVLAFYRSMALIVDGESDPLTPFAAMLDCGGPAALWAALAHDRLPAGRGVNRDAILRAFLALPPHLKVHLGSDLAGKFLARGDTDAARLIRDAMDRAPGADAARIALLDADADLHGGRIDAALIHAERAVALEGDTPDGLVALVEAHFRKMEPIDPRVPAALLALKGETDAELYTATVGRAIVLGLALSGQTAAAFAQDDASGQVLADLWQIIANLATDDAFLRHAVLPETMPRPDLPPEVALGIAGRLLGLGFPEAARGWIGPVSATDPADRRLAAAKAAFDHGDARESIRILSGMGDPATRSLRAKALVQLGNLAEARLELAAVSDGEAVARVALWARDWGKLAPEAPAPWRDTAVQLAPATVPGGSGLLARGNAMVDASHAARQAIEKLLSAVPSPEGG